jgi:hypothetical protein
MRQSLRVLEHQANTALSPFSRGSLINENVKSVQHWPVGLKSGGTELKFEMFRIVAYVMYIVSGFTFAGKGCAAG